MPKNGNVEAGGLPQIQEFIISSNNSLFEIINISVFTTDICDTKYVTGETQACSHALCNNMGYEVDSGPLDPVLEEYKGFYTDGE